MARPRVFISSTYYDLKHIRASLENFVESLGFDPILSEKGNIAYDPTIPLDESCYREVGNADIFVLIIGTRYGAEKSESRSEDRRSFYERYDSITKGEYQSADEKDIPIYVLIERSAYADYETYLRNKDNKSINYAHVDSVNVCILVEEILAKHRNNPVQQFDRYSEIQAWLREQWAGLFRDLLRRKTSQQQIASRPVGDLHADRAGRDGVFQGQDADDRKSVADVGIRHEGRSAGHRRQAGRLHLMVRRWSALVRARSPAACAWRRASPAASAAVAYSRQSGQSSWEAPLSFVNGPQVSCTNPARTNVRNP